jgi:hypothetical protein
MGCSGHQLLFLSCVAIAAPLTVGCSDQGQKDADRAAVVEHNKISPEEARTALAQLVEAEFDDDVKRWLLKDLRTQPIRQREDGAVGIGPFRCRLAKGRFKLFLTSPGLDIEYSGTFTRQRNGAWRATIDQRVEVHKPEK